MRYTRDTKIEEVELFSVRMKESCKNAKLETVGQLLDLTKADIIGHRSLTRSCVREIEMFKEEYADCINEASDIRSMIDTSVIDGVSFTKTIGCIVRDTDNDSVSDTMYDTEFWLRTDNVQSFQVIRDSKGKSYAAVSLDKKGSRYMISYITKVIEL